MKLFFLLLLGASWKLTLQQDLANEERTDQCECGMTSKCKRIVGGTESSCGKYPWMVALIQYSNGNYAQFCGGCLVSHQWLVTAAHCISSEVTESSLVVSLGDFDLSTTTEAKSVARKVSKIAVHPQYNTKTHDYDIAMVKLASPVNFTDNIQPICLPPTDFNATGKMATVAGWGATAEDGETSSRLREADIPVISKTQCQSAYGSNYPITENMLCAGYPQGHKDSCQGDSGGPLFYQCPNGRRTLVGVVSFGIGCARPGLPGVYADAKTLQPYIISYATGDGLCRTVCS